MTDEKNLSTPTADPALSARAKDLATDAAKAARDAAADAARRAQKAAAEKSKTILDSANVSGDKGLTAIGEKLDQAASYVDDRLGTDEDRAEKVQKVTAPVHKTAGYLKEHDPKSIVGEVDESIHKHPYRAMGVALVVGWVIGRLVRTD